MNRKPVEIERQMVAKNATEQEISEARANLNDAARRKFPAYRYTSENQYVQGKLLCIVRTYDYSRWRDLVHLVKSLFTTQEETCQN
jgi:hypothetical protein